VAGSPQDPRFAPRFARWLWASFAGWVLGFVLVLIGAVALESVGVHTQAIVGIGMGLGVGLVQARVARDWMCEPKAWVFASSVGMGGAFVVLEIFGHLLGGVAGRFGGFGPVTAAALVCGSILVGLLQRMVVRESLGEGRLWVLASLLAWSLAGATAIGGTTLLGGLRLAPWLGFGLALVLLLSGGLVLGAITGAALTRRARV
jgi:hypothetical protein